MKSIKIIILLTLGIFLGSCGDKATSLVYNETKCADPWIDLIDPSNEALKVKVEAHLDDLMIAYTRVYITNDGNAQDCEACSCTTERRIHVEAEEVSYDALEDLGFIIE